MLHLRLSLIPFLLFFLYGAVIPIFSLLMIDYLGFSKNQTGIILAMSSLSAFATPLVSTFITDRLFSAERLFSAILLVGGAALWFLASVKTFPVFLCMYTVYALSIGPANSLSNAVIFHHIPSGSKNYGTIRVWGTIGWILVAWLFSWIWLQNFGRGHDPSRLPDALRLGALTAIALGLYCFTIPVSGVVHDRKDKSLIPRDSLQVIRRPRVLIIFAIAMLYSITDRFFFYGAAPFLKNAGVSPSWLLPVMTLCQVLEIPAMFLLGRLLSKWGVKWVLLLGIASNVMRYLLFTTGDSVTVYAVGLMFHGMAYTFFSAGIFIYLDEQSTRFSRAGVQLLYGINTSGIGNGIGYLLAGQVAAIFIPKTGTAHYSAFWAFPLGITVVITVIVLFLSHREDGED